MEMKKKWNMRRDLMVKVFEVLRLQQGLLEILLLLNLRLASAVVFVINVMFNT